MLIWFVVFYLLISVGIGLVAATRVHTSKDFAVAGRSLGMPIVFGTVFATWFGAEAIFGVSATFVKDGLTGVVADPFGSSICLILAAILFSRYLYKLNIITLGDFYRMRYSRSVEVITTLCIVVSYLGWVAAQIKALGLIFTVLTDGAVSTEIGTVLGAIIVVTYTMFGGMLSVAILDFVQMIVMIGGLLFIGWIVSDKVPGGVSAVVDHASLAGKLDFFPPADLSLWLTFIGAGVTMMLGSIPQQDVFQRITSAKTQRIALIGSILGATTYFGVCFIPMFIAYAATMIDPATFNAIMEKDSQLVLPTLVMQHTPMVAQVAFYGAVLSAIMSTASATLLAPSVTFAENIIKEIRPGMNDKQSLWAMRFTVLVFSVMVLGFALYSTDSIFKMVENAYKVTLAGAFMPLVGGMLWKRATTQGALASIAGGLISWLLIEILVGEGSPVPPQLVGLLVSGLGLVLGSLLPQWVGHRQPGRPMHELHAAAATHHVGSQGHHHH